VGAAGTTGAAGTGVAGTTGGAAGATGAAGTTGAAGAGAAGTGAAALVQPIMRGNLYVLEFGKTKFVVDPAAGARITEFSLDGTNILTGPTANAMYWGSTLWSAPEGEWLPKGLLPAYDTGMFTMTVGADSSISGSGPTSTVGTTKMVAVTKKFSADLAKGAIAIDYSLTNKGTNTYMLGHWEVTRVPPDGLTFFPVGTGAPVNNAGVISTCCLTTMNGTVWSDHSKYNPPSPASTNYAKYSIDGAGGWVAHVVKDAAGPILLVKTFKDIPVGTAGTGHGEVEIYFDPARKYVEVEDHNQQTSFTAGATIPWSVRWYLRRLPQNVAAMVGNQALVDYVKTLIQ
jgi:hypothetical protein